MVKNFFIQFFNFFGVFIISLAIVLPIRYFVVQPFLVKGESMHPTFQNLDYLFVERVSYYFRNPGRGEVVVFRFPKNENDYFIKRVIGLPRERVIIDKGVIHIISPEKKEPIILDEGFYLGKNFSTQGNIDSALGASEFFVLGDNREASFDSRFWGVLPSRDIVGRVLVRVWPPAKAKAFFGNYYPVGSSSM